MPQLSLRNRYWIKAGDGLTMLPNPDYRPTIWHLLLKKFFRKRWTEIHQQAGDWAYQSESKYSMLPPRKTQIVLLRRVGE